jgi:hypothetical protein
MMEVFFNRKGKVIEGKDAGKFVLLEDDSKGSTGGYYLYESVSNFEKDTPVSDTWLEDYEMLRSYLVQNKIEWL